MKIKPEHYAHIKTCISELKEKIKPHREYLIKEGKAKDIEKRLRWDMFWATKQTHWVCDNLYSYMNDDHLDTALRHIMAELEA